MTRPQKLTDEIANRFLEAIKNGNTIKNSCAYAGISTAIFYVWKEYAKTGPNRGLRADVARLMESYTRLEAEAMNEAVVRIRKAGSGETVLQRVTTTRKRPDGTDEVVVTETMLAGEWRADAWFLERRNPREWGRRDRTPVDMDREAERLAKELGIPVEELLAEADMLAQSEG